MLGEGTPSVNLDQIESTPDLTPKDYVDIHNKRLIELATKLNNGQPLTTAEEQERNILVAIGVGLRIGYHKGKNPTDLRTWIDPVTHKRTDGKG